MSKTVAVPSAVRDARVHDDGGAMQYVYVAPSLQASGLLGGISLADTTERHPAELRTPSEDDAPDLVEALRRPHVEGAVFEMAGGLPADEQLRLIGATVNAGR